MSSEQGDIAPTRWGESEIRGPVHLFRERLLLRLFRSMLSEGCVLDAGCGSGSLALDLCRAGYRVEAIEHSPEFVAFVGERIERLGVGEQLRVKQGSVTRIEFPDAAFDGLVCGEVLEHVLPEDGGDTKGVEEFARVLRPGGVCVASVPFDPRLWDHADEWAGHVKRYGREEFARLFEERGFRLEKVRVWGFPLGRIYHRLLFGPWLKRTAGQAVEAREGRLDTRAGRHPLLANLIAGALRLDELFMRWPWGRGVIVCARRLGAE